MNKVLILTGLSGAGKDSVADALKSKGFTSAVPHTTRPMREGESEGNPYHFISLEQYLRLDAMEEFVESNRYLTKFDGVESWSFYGTSKDALRQDGMLMLTIGVQSALRTKDRIKDAILIYVDAPDSIREERARSRGSFDQIEWENRLAQDIERRKNNEFPLELMDAVVNNTQSLEKTVDEVLYIYNTLNKET